MDRLYLKAMAKLDEACMKDAACDIRFYVNHLKMLLDAKEKSNLSINFASLDSTSREFARRQQLENTFKPNENLKDKYTISFREGLKDIAKTFAGDEEVAHRKSDQLLVLLLTMLGYYDVIEEYEKIEKQYS